MISAGLDNKISEQRRKVIYAKGAGFPVVESLENLFITIIVLVLLTLEGDPRNPTFHSEALRELFKNFCQRNCQSKLEVIIRNILYIEIRACFDNLFDTIPRRAFKEFRRIKEFKKKRVFQRLQAFKRF